MKKFLVFVIAAVLLGTLLGFSNTADSASIFDSIKTKLKKYPSDIHYSADLAAKDGHYVIVHGRIKGGQEKWNAFLKAVNNKKDASVSIVQYTTEGDALIIFVSYYNDQFYWVEDDTRDQFGSQQYFEGSYPYLKTFKSDSGYTITYLLNDDTLTLDDIQKSQLSSSSKDHIDCRSLFYINAPKNN